MTNASEDRAGRLAELLGAAQEARRLRHRLVGSEHLLMATFADPTVRSSLLGVGCDLRDVQVLVTQVGRARQVPGAGPTLTAPAADLLLRAASGLPEADLDRQPDPRLLSLVLGAVMILILRDEQDTAARRILDDLGVLRHASRLVTDIQQNAGSAFLPRHD